MAPPATPEDRLPLVVSGLFILIGGIVLTSGVVLFIQTVLFVGKARLSPGVVVGEQRSRTVTIKGQSQFRAVSVMDAPVVLFRDEAGVHHRFTALASTQETFEVGETLPILYDPGHPERARIRSFDALWMRPILLMGFGVVMAGGSAWMLSMFRRLQNPEVLDSRRRRRHRR